MARTGVGPAPVARFISSGTVRDDHEDVHLGTQSDMVAGLGPSVRDFGAPVGAHRHPHEEVDVGHNQCRVDPVAGKLGFEVLLARAGIARAIAHVVELEGAATEDRVVAAAGVFDVVIIFRASTERSTEPWPR